MTSAYAAVEPTMPHPTIPILTRWMVSLRGGSNVFHVMPSLPES
jgi:hypothetical protein